MRVDNIHLQRDSDTIELSGMIDDYRLWFRFPPEYTLSTRGDAFLAAALFPAMLKGESLKIASNAPVSLKMLQGIERIQNIFCFWYPMFHRVTIHATISEPEYCNEGIGCFFSGGVDGTYTFLKHKEEITHLLFIKGIDMQLDNDELFMASLKANRAFADQYGKKLIPIESNIRFFGHHHPPLNWEIYCGAGLASVALVVGFPHVSIAASHTYSELFPWGSHVTTDYLWSTEATEFHHDGAEASRSQKLSEIAKERAALDVLRVCWNDAGYNCGKCEKCLRTMAALRALHLSSVNLPPLTSLDAIKALRIYDVNTLSFWQDNLELAERQGDVGLHAVIQRMIRRYRLKQLADEADTLLLRSVLKRLFRRKIKPTPASASSKPTRLTSANTPG